MRTLLFLLLPLFSFGQGIYIDSLYYTLRPTDTLTLTSWPTDTIPVKFLVSERESTPTLEGFYTTPVFVIDGYVLRTRRVWREEYEFVDHLFNPIPYLIWHYKQCGH